MKRTRKKKKKNMRLVIYNGICFYFYNQTFNQVADIVDHKMMRGKLMFKIRWKGYTKGDDTWEAESDVNCPDIIQNYQERVS